MGGGSPKKGIYFFGKKKLLLYLVNIIITV